MSIQATLCLIAKDDKILLLKKSKGLLGEGKWNAPGGKVLPNEGPRACAVREVFEETQLSVTEPEQVGNLYFYNNGVRLNPVWIVYFSCLVTSTEFPSMDERAISNGSALTLCLSTRCGKMTNTGTDWHLMGPDLKDGSITRAILRS